MPCSRGVVMKTSPTPPTSSCRERLQPRIFIYPVITLCGPLFLIPVQPCFTVRFGGGILLGGLVVMMHLAKRLMIPFRPEQNIITAVDGNDVIDNLRSNIDAQLLAFHTQRMMLQILSPIFFP